jgi:hypothetical protein
VVTTNQRRLEDNEFHTDWMFRVRGAVLPGLSRASEIPDSTTEIKADAQAEMVEHVSEHRDSVGSDRTAPVGLRLRDPEAQLTALGALRR